MAMSRFSPGGPTGLLRGEAYMQQHESKNPRPSRQGWKDPRKVAWSRCEFRELCDWLEGHGKGAEKFDGLTDLPAPDSPICEGLEADHTQEGITEQVSGVRL